MSRSVFAFLLMAASTVSNLFTDQVKGLPKGTDEKPVAVQRDVYPFLKRHCVSCHNDADPKARRSLTGYQDKESIRADAEAWDDIVKHVRDGTMPPAQSKQPTPKEAAAFLDHVARLRAEK